MESLANENLWRYLPLIIWISGIFYLSSDRGSVATTSRFVNPVLSSIFPDREPETRRRYHIFLRKTCHFLGYAFLALFASLVFYYSSIPFLAKFWYLFSFATVVIIASADEFKQSFYASREGTVSDVMIDSTGGLTMILLFWLSTF